MKQSEIIRKAKELNLLNNKIKTQENIINVLGWLDFLGLLQGNHNKSFNTEVTLKDLLEAATIEPRIYELLPVIICELSSGIKFETKDIPLNLQNVISAIQTDQDYPNYYYATPSEYLQWFNSPALKLAKERINLRSKPRKRNGVNNNLSTIIKTERTKLGFTQEHFAARFNLSLRVLRDLEQGNENVGFDKVKAILSALGIKISYELS